MRDEGPGLERLALTEASLADVADAPRNVRAEHMKVTVAAGIFGTAPAPVRIGRFELLSQLGRGGMGVVYEARDGEDGTVIALKTLVQMDPAALHRLKREFRELADVHHPNLVRLHELRAEDGCWFVTMELVRGVPFTAWVRHARDSFDAARLRHSMLQLVDGVQALHRAGKLHRDLKPENVLIREDGSLSILDFGLVGTLDGTASTHTGGMGTPAYMAPEQVVGAAPGEAADWYAIGVMLFEALTGRRPFEGTSGQILCDKQLRAAPSPRDLVPSLPESLTRLCEGLLRSCAEARLDGAAVVAALEGENTNASRDANSVGGETAFVGRRESLQRLESAFADVLHGAPRTVLVSGPSGIGKTVLCQEFTRHLGAHVRVFKGRCYERESVPYKAFDAVIDALVRHLIRLPADQVNAVLPRGIKVLANLFPALERVPEIASAPFPWASPPDASQQRLRAFSALKEMLQRLSDRSPLVLWIDDLQWGDLDSARLLERALCPPDPPRLLLIGAFRCDPDSRSEFLSHARRAGGFADPTGEAVSIELGPLSDAEATALAALHGGGESSPLVGREAEGIPLFVRALAESQRRQRGTQEKPSRPLSLAQVLRERIAPLSPEARRLLETLSVAAGPLETRIAAEASGLGPNPRESIAELSRASLARCAAGQAADALETYHDRVRETVVSSLAPARKREVHRRIATAMRRGGSMDLEALVVHHLGAGEPQLARQVAMAAARQARDKLAFDRAADLFRTTIELSSCAVDACGPLYESLGEALANAGRGARAAEAYLEAARDASPDEALRLRGVAAQQYLRAGHLKEGLPLAIELLKDVGVQYPEGDGETVRKLAWDLLVNRLRGRALRPSTPPPTPSTLQRLETLGSLYKEFVSFDPMRGTFLHGRFLRGALSAGEPAALMQAVAWEALTLAMAKGELAGKRVDALVGHAVHMAEHIDTPYARATALMARAGVDMCLGRFADVHELASRGEEIFRTECTGVAWELTVSALWRWAVTELAGDLGSLIREAPERERDAAEREDEYARASLAHMFPLALLMQDRSELALRKLGAQTEWPGGRFTVSRVWVMNRTADVWLYRGEPEEALRHLERELPAFSGSYLSKARIFRVNSYFLRGRVALALAPRAPERLREAMTMSKRLRAFGRPDATLYGALLQGAVHAIEGRGPEAQASFEHAVRVGQQASMKNFVCYAKRNLGQVLGGDAGAALIEAADAQLRKQGVALPARFVATYAPGFG